MVVYKTQFLHVILRTIRILLKHAGTYHGDKFNSQYGNSEEVRSPVRNPGLLSKTCINNKLKTIVLKRGIKRIYLSND